RYSPQEQAAAWKALEGVDEPEQRAALTQQYKAWGFRVPPHIAAMEAAGIAPQTELQREIAQRTAMAHAVARVQQIVKEQGMIPGDQAAVAEMARMDLPKMIGLDLDDPNAPQDKLKLWKDLEALRSAARDPGKPPHAVDALERIRKLSDPYLSGRKTEREKAEELARKQEAGIARKDEALVQKEQKANQLKIAERAEKRADDRLKELKGEMEKLEKDKEGELGAVTDEQLADKRAEIDAAGVDRQAASTQVDRLLAGQPEPEFDESAIGAEEPGDAATFEVTPIGRGGLPSLLGEKTATQPASQPVPAKGPVRALAERVDAGMTAAEAEKEYLKLPESDRQAFSEWAARMGWLAKWQKEVAP
ncbi:MAG TPA: hypothetical protein VMW52_04180, partial [Phycisphaerae bacterium]|nr:hypothetical protein [Phycisphaerae bacterium]